MPKYGRDSVARNRLKRRLRDIIRRTVLPLIPPLDIVIRVRPTAYDAPFAVLQEQGARLGEQLNEAMGT